MARWRVSPTETSTFDTARASIACGEADGLESSQCLQVFSLDFRHQEHPTRSGESPTTSPLTKDDRTEKYPMTKPSCQLGELLLEDKGNGWLRGHGINAA